MTPNKQYPKESFRPNADVERMLKRAKADNLKVSKLVNAALFKHLTELGYARKKEAAL
jgi:hypothetical protein